jgi:hypothetical protein
LGLLPALLQVVQPVEQLALPQGQEERRELLVQREALPVLALRAPLQLAQVLQNQSRRK